MVDTHLPANVFSNLFYNRRCQIDESPFFNETIMRYNKGYVNKRSRDINNNNSNNDCRDTHSILMYPTTK